MTNRLNCFQGSMVVELGWLDLHLISLNVSFFIKSQISLDKDIAAIKNLISSQTI